MVPFTIFHRLSSLGSGGGMNADTIPPVVGTERTALFRWAEFLVWFSFTRRGEGGAVTTVT